MPDLASAIDPSSILIIGVLLIAVGLALAFLGRKLWTPFMSLVGAIIGGSVGYFVGVYYTNSPVTALILAVIGSVLGSILFNYLVKIALALIAAFIPSLLVYRALNPNPVQDQSAQQPAVIVAILVMLVVFAIAYYFVEELIGIVTALVGSFLFGVGVWFPTARPDIAIGLAALVFFVGAISQTVAIRGAKKGGVWRLRRARAAAMAPSPAPMPPPSPPSAQPAPPTSPPTPSPPPANPPPPPPP